MSKSNTFENDLLKLEFQGTAITALAQNGSSPITDLTVALHTADPGETGDQTTNEVQWSAYAQYLRVNVVRSSGGWTVSGSSVKPLNPITFPEMTSGAGCVATHWSIGTGIGDKLLRSGPITPNITIAVNVIPQLSTDTEVTED